MQGNRFEDEVQRSLGGLKVHPTADVWNNLEKALRAKKKRRFILVFFTLAGFLLLGSAGYFFFNNQSNDAVANNNSLTGINSGSPETIIPGKTNNQQATDTSAYAPATDHPSATTGAPVNNGKNGFAGNDVPKATKQDAINLAPSPVKRSQPEVTVTSTDKTATAKSSTVKISTDKSSTVKSSTAKSLTVKISTDKSSTVKSSTVKTSTDKASTVMSSTVKSSTDKVSMDKASTDKLSADNNADHAATAGRKENKSALSDAGKTVTGTPVTSRMPGNTSATTTTNRPQPAADIIKDSMKTNAGSSVSATASPGTASGGSVPATVPLTGPSDSTVLAKASSVATSDSSVAAAATVAKIKKPSVPKWQWVGSVSGGLGNLGKMKTSKPSMDVTVLDNPVFLAPSNAPGIPTNAAAILPPSESHAGFAFQVSAGLKYKLTRRSSLFAGLMYTFSSNQISVGEYRNIAQQQSYSPAYNTTTRAYTGYPDKSFTDKYHIISLPLKYQFIINPASALKVQWNAGLTPGYLVASDALVYSPSLGGSYSHDKSVYNRFRLGVGTGFDLLMGKGTGLRWSVGPEVSMSLRRLSDNLYDNQQNMYYGGLTGRIYFGK
ncbi:MAG: hypothetical protein EOO05_12280 [Chitinophagaceae bacterium]|nr:MAG: hypothetical protein EOO05_12280 [Chitinophagaceae bacterium]